MDKSITVKKNRSIIDADQQVDFGQLKNEIVEKISKWDPSHTFSLSELAREVGESPANLLYLEKKYGILSPDIDKKGDMDVRRYRIPDLRNALFTLSLKELGFTPKQITPLLTLTNLDENVSSQASAPVPIVDVGLDFVERYKVQALGRLLQIVSQKICNNELLPDALIIISPVNENLGQNPISIQVSQCSKRKVESIIRNNYRQIPIGWSTNDGEVFTRYKNVEDLIRRLDNWELFAITLNNPHIICSFEIIIGIMKDSADSQVLAVKKWLSQETLPISNDEQILLCKIIEIIFNVILVLDSIIRYDSFDRLKTMSQGDMLSVLADSIVKIAPHKWDYCGVLLPLGEDSAALHLAAASTTFPQILRGRALYQIDKSVPGWVYQTGKPLVINHVVNDDPRILFQALERPKAIAVVPALRKSREPKGLLYVGTRNFEHNQIAFTELDIKILGIFGEIAGEIIGRRQLNQQAVYGALNLFNKSPIKYGTSQDFSNSLMNTLRTIRNQTQEIFQTDNSILILAVRITNQKELFSVDTEFEGWVANEVGEKFGRFLEEKKVNFPDVDTTVYRLNSDKFIGLINHVRSNISKIREELIDELTKLKNFGMSIPVEVQIWSLPFTYRELIPSSNPEEIADQILEQKVEMLIKRTKGALKVLTYIQRGDKYIEEREFEKAAIQYEMAHNDDPENPYHLRHLAECLIEMKRFDEAIKVAEKAIALDPNYPGSYIRLAEAYVEKGNYDKGIEYYEQAINLRQNDPRTHLKFSQALILNGERDNIKRAVDELSIAMRFDLHEDEIQAQYLRYIGQAWMQIGEYSLAVDSYQWALKFDPRNGDLEWELRIARNKLRSIYNN